MSGAEAARAIVEKIADCVRREVHRVGARRAVIALDGRPHATIAAALAVRALGPSQLHVVAFPPSGAPAAAAVGIGSIDVVDPAPFEEALRRVAPAADRGRRAAFDARVRAALLLDAAEARLAVAIGARSKTDRLLGVGAAFADPAEIDPIGDLWGTDVRALAPALGLDAAALGDDPPLELPGTAAEGGTLDPTYASVDGLLRLIVDARLRPRDVVASSSYRRADVQRVGAAIRAARARGAGTIVPAVSARPLATEYRFARDANS